MLKNENIICISSIDWDFIWQGHQEIMSIFAKNSNRVLFIENTGVRPPGIRDIPRIKKRIKNYFRGIKGIRKEHDNLYIFSPIILPFPYSWIAHKINKFLLLSVLEKWMKLLDFSDPIIWTFLPTGITLGITNSINKKIIIYYCIDNFHGSSSSAKKVRITEKKLLKKADLVFVTSKALYDYCREYNSNVSIFPFGVNISNFEKVRLARTEVPEELNGIGKPIVGYIGGIHRWIDQKLVKAIALNSPDFAFVFVGPLQTDISFLSDVKNIYFLGNKDHKKLPYLIKYFSVTMIPYLINDYTRNVYPTKLNEYLSMGKPVVSTDLPEVRFFNQKYEGIVYVAQAAGEFCACINNAVNQDNDSLRQMRIEAAKDNNWQSRIEQMSNIIDRTVEKKMVDKEAIWREGLLFLYRRARRKFVQLALTLILAYSFIFYTPLLWFIASPLKISQAPKKTDAIVVFAGGVGESGRAGQGYEERVQFAVELYKNGYASHMIFCSGYKYIFEEPLLMKTLAVSLGIPPEVIILEEKARNTYENVKFSKQILDKQKWNKILLVSSPYHMWRVSLVFNKMAKNIEVTYAPLPNSLFYSRRNKDAYGRRAWKQINLQQIEGIFREYIGILYYWFKGYI